MFQNKKSIQLLQTVKQSQLKLNLYGKQAIVVGGTSGIGNGIAMRLAQANANVAIVGRNKAAGLKIVEEMKKASLSIPDVANRNPADQPPKFTFIESDVSLIGQVKKTSEFIKDLVPKVDYLVCTQGTSNMDGQIKTKEGISNKLSLHYYSRFAFAYYLNDLLQKSVDPRFVTVLSAGVHKPYQHFIEDPFLESNYSMKNMADAAGLYNDLGIAALSKRHSQISYIHIAPGFVSTNWGQDLPFYMKPLLSLGKQFAKSKEDCAEFLCQTIFNPIYKAPGYYLLDEFGQPTKPTDYQHPDNIEVFWKHTEDYLKKF